jgi:hypothetical protein
MLEADELAAVCTGLRQLLDPTRTEPWAVPLDAARFQEIATRHRLHAFLDLHRERLILPDGADDAFAESVRTERLSCLIQIRETLDVLALLRDAGIPALAFKGPALAVQVYADQAGRGPGDIDILVDPDRVEYAYRVLCAAGWLGDTSRPLPGPTATWRYLKRIYYELTLVDDQMSIDLHWHLGPTRYGLPTFAEVWARRVEVELAGVPVPTLSQPDAFVHACHHATKERWRTLRALLDVRLLAEREELLPARPSRPTRLTLGLVDRQLGLPAQALGLARPSEHIARMASRWQLLPSEPVAAFPGARIPSNIAARIRESHHPVDLARITTYMVLSVEDNGTGTVRGLVRARFSKGMSLFRAAGRRCRTLFRPR